MGQDFVFYSHLKRYFSFPQQSLIIRLTNLIFFLVIASVQNTIITGNMVCILFDLDDVVQEVGFEKAGPAFVEVVVDLLVQAIYQDSFLLVV